MGICTCTAQPEATAGWAEANGSPGVKRCPPGLKRADRFTLARTGAPGVEAIRSLQLGRASFHPSRSVRFSPACLRFRSGCACTYAHSGPAAGPRNIAALQHAEMTKSLRIPWAEALVGTSCRIATCANDKVAENFPRHKPQLQNVEFSCRK